MTVNNFNIIKPKDFYLGKGVHIQVWICYISILTMQHKAENLKEIRSTLIIISISQYEPHVNDACGILVTHPISIVCTVANYGVSQGSSSKQATLLDKIQHTFYLQIVIIAIHLTTGYVELSLMVMERYPSYTQQQKLNLSGHIYMQYFKSYFLTHFLYANSLEGVGGYL